MVTAKERLASLEAYSKSQYTGIQDIKADNTLWRKEFKEQIIPEIKANSEFRQRAKGLIGGISFVSVAFGGAIMWVISKFRGSN